MFSFSAIQANATQPIGLPSTSPQNTPSAAGFVTAPPSMSEVSVTPALARANSGRIA